MIVRSKSAEHASSNSSFSSAMLPTLGTGTK